MKTFSLPMPIHTREKTSSERTRFCSAKKDRKSLCIFNQAPYGRVVAASKHTGKQYASNAEGNRRNTCTAQSGTVKYIIEFMLVEGAMTEDRPIASSFSERLFATHGTILAELMCVLEAVHGR